MLDNLEIIAMVAIAVIVIAFVAYKISVKPKIKEIVEDEHDSVDHAEQNSSNVIEDEFDNPSEVIVKLEQEAPVLEVQHSEEDMGSVEGDFGAVEESVETTPEPKGFQKREVPPHGKISKENFSEFSGQRILVAEDNLINQKVILGLLADSGIEVIIANDGQEAINILENDTNFSVILMDAHMPNIDGFEATRMIRANQKCDHIVVVALSGDTAADDIRKMTEAGMSEHLEKPLKMDALYDILYAYATEDDSQQKSEDDEVIHVISTKELDGEKGLDICGGDETFYREILNEFLETYSDSDEKLLEMLQNSQMEQASKLLLDIIGVSANIGAVKLNNVATYIKDSLSDSEEKSYLTLMQQYQQRLHTLLKDIKEYLK